MQLVKLNAQRRAQLKVVLKQNNWFLELISIILLLLFFLPIFIVVINIGKTSNTEIFLDPLGFSENYLENAFNNIRRIITHPQIRYFTSFMYSFLITSISLTAIGIFSAMGAWVLVRNKSIYSKIIFYIFLSGLVIPFQVVMLPLVRLLQDITNMTGIPMKETLHGIILTYIGFGAPLSVFLFFGFIKSVPLEIEEAAIIDGCTQSQVFFKVVFPILKPVFVTMLVLNGLWIWNDYLLPVLVLGVNNSIQTLPLSVGVLAGLYDKDWPLILTQVLLAAIPLLILFFFVQKHIIKGMTSGAIK